MYTDPPPGGRAPLACAGATRGRMMRGRTFLYRWIGRLASASASAQLVPGASTRHWLEVLAWAGGASWRHRVPALKREGSSLGMGKVSRACES